MDVDELDATILSHAREHWLKVARIAAEVLDARGVPPSDDQVDVVVAHMRALVAQGLLVYQGNLSRPRFSEVRLPGGEDREFAPVRDLRP